ncbi:MAG: hypothetical protein AAGG51_20280 [Cyanobacteria bacterium P01_G01_bin.54]
MKPSRHPYWQPKWTPWQWLKGLWRRAEVGLRQPLALPLSTPKRSAHDPLIPVRELDALPRWDETFPQSATSPHPQSASPPPPTPFILGLDSLKGLEYLSAQELLAYVNWPRAMADVEMPFSLDEMIDQVVWGDEDEDEDLTVPTISDLPMSSPEPEPRPSSFLLGLDGFANLAALSVAEFSAGIPWQDRNFTATATEEDLSLLGDLLVEFPE